MKFTILTLASIFLFVGFAFILVPDTTYAQAGGLVPCNGPECNLCHLAQLAEKVINFIVQISFVIAALLFAYAGFLYFTAGSDPGKVSSAHKILTDTIVGIIIILTAWLVVNVILTVLTGKGVNPFTQILCSADSKSIQKVTPQSSGSVKVTGTSPQTNGGGGGTEGQGSISQPNGGSAGTEGQGSATQGGGSGTEDIGSTGWVPVSPGTGIKSIILDRGDASGAAAFLDSCPSGNVGSSCIDSSCTQQKYTCY